MLRSGLGQHSSHTSDVCSWTNSQCCPYMKEILSSAVQSVEINKHQNVLSLYAVSRINPL